MKYITLLLLICFLPQAVFANTHSTNLVRADGEYWSITDAAQTGLDLTADHSISVWIKNTTAPGTNEEWAIVQKYLGSSGQRGFLYNYEDSGGTKRFHFRTSANGNSVTEGTINHDLGTATWHHVCIVYDGSATDHDLYIDGAAVGTSTSAASTIVDNTQPFIIGASPGTFTGDGYYDGDFDELLVYNTELTAAECVALNDDPCNPSTTSLVSRWDFDNDADDDPAEAGNDLTGTNDPTFTTDTAFSCAAAAPATTPEFLLISWLIAPLSKPDHGQS
jgi:hypothetical protein